MQNIENIKERLAVIRGQLGDLAHELDNEEMEKEADFQNLSECEMECSPGKQIEALCRNLMLARRTIEQSARDLELAQAELETALGAATGESI